MTTPEQKSKAVRNEVITLISFYEQHGWNWLMAVEFTIWKSYNNDTCKFAIWKYYNDNA